MSDLLDKFLEQARKLNGDNLDPQVELALEQLRLVIPIVPPVPDTYWMVSLSCDYEYRWNDATWVVGAKTPNEAVKLAVEAKNEDCADDEPTARGWAIPMRAPSKPSYVSPDRKYQAEEFESMWDYDLEVEVKL